MTTLTQRSEAWLKMRQEKIGASDAPIIMGVSPWKKPLQLWEEKLGFRPPEESNQWMLRGIELEDDARNAFIFETGIYVTPRVVQHKILDWMIASLDGIDDKNENIIEIKCPGRKDHMIAKEGYIPNKYIPQLQHQMSVCDLKKAFYFSYYNGDTALIEVKRDDQYIDLMIEQEERFWKCMQNFTPPDW